MRHDDGSGKPLAELPLRESRQINPPRRLRPGSTTLYYPVQAEVFDTRTGLVTWQGTGLLTNPNNMASGSGAPDEALIWSYTMYDMKGRVIEEVTDAAPGAYVASARPGTTGFNNPPQIGPGFGRIPDTPALNLNTSHANHDDEGPQDIYFSNGRRWSRRTVILQPVPEGGSPGLVNNEEPNDPIDLNTVSNGNWAPRRADSVPARRDFIFNDLEWKTVGMNLHWVASSPGSVVDYESAGPRVITASYNTYTTMDSARAATVRRAPLIQYHLPSPIRTRRVAFVQPNPGLQPIEFDPNGFLNDPKPEKQPLFRTLSGVEYKPDEYGKLSEASNFERDSRGIMVPSGEVKVNDLGEMYRAMSIDGSITRLIKNSLGHVLRKYTGTIDDPWLGLAGGSLASGPVPDASPSSGHNMVLTERNEYGAGTNNAWLPTVVRRYTTNEGMDWTRSPFAALPPGAVDHGQATVTSYDWRMRPVREDIHAAGAPTAANRLLTTFTYLNHAGQARLVATFGEGALPMSLDPSTFAPDRDPATMIPSPQQFFASGSLRPLALVESIYAADGSVEETRTYDVGWNGSGSVPYTAEREHSGFSGSTVFRNGPGEEAEVSTVDSLGRVTSTAAIMPRSGAGAFTYQISRTDYTHDNDGNVIRTDQWERIVESFATAGAGDVLSSSNAVRSTTLNWYDSQRRLVAIADYGTGLGPDAAFTSDTNDASLGILDDWSSIDNRPSLNMTSRTVDREFVPNNVPLSLNHYNIKGELAFVVSQRSGDSTQAPIYSITGYTYTGTGKTAKVIENPFSPASEQRVTVHHYEFGRLAGITAQGGVTVPATDTDQQTIIASGATSTNSWGALVVDTGVDGAAMTPLSRSASVASSFELPDKSKGAVFTYDFQGRLVERRDARGVTMRYRYDALDRLRTITVGHYLGSVFHEGYNEAWRHPGAKDPVDMVAFVQYDYDANHRLTDARAFDAVLGGNLISHTRFTYDARGNLINDIQGIGAPVHNLTPRTTYAWDSTHATADRVGRTRLTSVSYPHHPSIPGQATRRTVTLGYGTAASDILSRITTINSTPAASFDPQNVATFTHTGGFRRAGASFAGGAIVADMGLDVSLTDGNGIGIRGLDRFGRLTDLHYKRGSSGGGGTPLTLTRLQSVLDLAGNRLSTRRTPHPLTPGVHARLQYDASYDALQRLSGATFNNFNSSNTASLLRGEVWTLDVFGNWVGATESVPGATTSTASALRIRANQYAQRTRSQGSTPLDVVEPIYDHAGNLAFDGTYAYQYDAWNRLVQVNLATRTPNPTPTPPTPNQDPLQFIVQGAMVKHYTHDAFGRLIRVQSPFPDQSFEGEFGVRTERLYYDGVRRVQEVVIDPAVTLDMALDGEGGSELQGEAQSIAGNAEGELDGSAAPGSLESQQILLDEDALSTTSVAREYVWGPGDWGVDELLVQYDAGRRATWPLSDSGGDVIALCDLGGASNSARVLTHIVYDAYGRVIGREDPATPATGPPELRVGHKGLFFDRLDLGIVDPLTNAETPRLDVGAKLIGYNRNRSLHVGWGRFLQRDPNATGLVVQKDLPFHGDRLRGNIQSFDLVALYGDGANTYQYIGSNPLGGSDPTGLFFSMGEIMMAGGTGAQIQGDHIDQTLDAGKSLKDFLSGPLHNYAFEQILDVNWALDWSQPDDLYRGSAAWSSGTGSWSAGAEAGASGGGHAIAGMKLPSLGNWGKKFNSPDMKGPGVYLIFDRDGNIVYAGRTSRHMSTRVAEHMERFKALNIETKGWTVAGAAISGKNQRRCVEAMILDLILKDEKVMNKIGGVSPSNKNANKYYTAGQNFLGLFK